MEEGRVGVELGHSCTTSRSVTNSEAFTVTMRTPGAVPATYRNHRLGYGVQ
jgi:GTP cyclohydrolase I